MASSFSRSIRQLSVRTVEAAVMSFPNVIGGFMKVSRLERLQDYNPQNLARFYGPVDYGDAVYSAYQWSQTFGTWSQGGSLATRAGPYVYLFALAMEGVKWAAEAYADSASTWAGRPIGNTIQEWAAPNSDVNPLSLVPSVKLDGPDLTVPLSDASSEASFRHFRKTPHSGFVPRRFSRRRVMFVGA